MLDHNYGQISHCHDIGDKIKTCLYYEIEIKNYEIEIKISEI